MPNFKFTKRKASTGFVVNNVMVIDSTIMPSDIGTFNTSKTWLFTQAQYQQILNLLNKDSSVDAIASLAGMILPCEWILDTGATSHMLSNF